MPFNVRSIAVTVAVLVFFVTAIIGILYDHSPFTCCKRALVAMFIAYVATTCIVKVVNVIVIDAMVTKQINQRLNRNINE